MNVIDKVHYETLHLKKLDTHTLRFTKGRLDFLRSCTLYIMYSYTLVLFCTWKRNVFENHSYIVYMTFFGIDYSAEYIRLAGFCQLIISVFMLAFWIVIYTPLIVREKWREIEQEAKNEFKRQQQLSLVTDKRKPLDFLLIINSHHINRGAHRGQQPVPGALTL